MPRPISLRLVLKILKEKNFFFISQKGSHAKFRKKGDLTRTVIVKMSKKKFLTEPFDQFCFSPASRKVILGIRKTKT